MSETGLIDKFLTWKEHSQGCTPTTCRKYRGYLNALVQFLAGLDKPIRQASRDDLERFAGLHLHEQGLTPRARRPAVAAVRGFYAWLRREGVLIEDPAAAIEYPRAGLRLPVGLSLQAAEKLLMAPDITTFQGLRDAAILMILIGGGLRISGLVALNQGDLLFVADDDGGERLVLKVREKGGFERLVPMPFEALVIVRAYLGHEELGRVDRTLPSGDQVLFISQRNRTVPPDKYHGEARRMQPRSINSMIEEYGKRHGIPRQQLHPHAMRHLYGTELAENDVDVLKIQAILGHKDPKTSQTYVHLAVRTLAKAVDKANPLGKIRTPVTELAMRLKRGR